MRTGIGVKVVLPIVAAIVVIGGGTSYYVYNQHEQKIKAEEAAQAAEAAHAKYRQELLTASLDLLGASELADGVCQQYSTVWNDAIFKNMATTSGGEVAFDMDTALADQEKDYQNDGTMNNLTAKKNTVDHDITLVNNPPSDFSRAYNDLLNMYSAYSQLLGEAQSPTGSLTEFNTNVDNLNNTILSNSNELKVVIPN